MKLTIPSEKRKKQEQERSNDVAEVASKQELDEIQLAYKAQKENEIAKFKQNTDSEFWIAIAFRTRAQKEEFLKLTGLEKLGDKFLFGEDVARILNIQLAGVDLKKPPKKLKKRFSDLVIGGDK